MAETETDAPGREAAFRRIEPGPEHFSLSEPDETNLAPPPAVAAGMEAPSSPSAPPGLPPPISVRYEILGEAGRGGMGIVYKARDRETGEVVALKVLKPEIAADPAVMQRFKNELLLARKITHKNVCRLYEFSRAGDAAYITMEFVEGESLRALLKRNGRPDLKISLTWARQIAEGMQEAHNQGVVHRDLKPENVFVMPEGWVKVMDFGIARSLEAPTLTQSLVGTPAYMAPEQAKGQRTDHRADIYSFGLMIYEMVTGTPAFQADTPMAMLLQQIQEIPRPPQEITPALPARLSRLILRCLEKDPANRFATTEELVQELSSDLAEDGTSPSTPLHGTPQEEPAPLSDQITPARAPAAPSEADFTVSRGAARALFLTIQVGYLAMYCAAAYYVESLQPALEVFLGVGAGVGVPFVIVLAMCGVSVRLYLLSSVGLGHPAAGAKFRRLFPVLFLLDTLWAASPLLLAEKIGYGLALVAVSALAYLPFVQRTLMRGIPHGIQPEPGARTP
ncbi:MAG: serine/threonine-protein kinase [Terriglobia bacterium]